MKVRDTAPIDYERDGDITKLVTRYLWQAFETSAPDTPARIFRVVLHALRTNGYDIITTKGEPMDNITLIERAIREDIAGRIEDLCQCTTFAMPGCDHMKAAAIARGRDDR